MVESLVVSLYLKYLLNQTDTHIQTQTQQHTLKHRYRNSNTHSNLSTEQTKAQGIGVKNWWYDEKVVKR